MVAVGTVVSNMRRCVVRISFAGDAIVVNLGGDDVHGDGGRGWGEVVAV